MTDDFAAHLTLEHRAPRDLISFSSSSLQKNKVNLCFSLLNKQKKIFQGFYVQIIRHLYILGFMDVGKSSAVCVVQIVLSFSRLVHQRGVCLLKLTFVDILLITFKPPVVVF